MSGGIYDGHRGGYSSNFDTYSSWKNNTKGLYNEYRIDGSWMNDGDYDKAFKGFPSHKTVNIFMGGTGYQEQSWGTTLLSGGIGLGITALGMWAMGLFGRNKAKAAQPSTALNLGLPTSGYWNSYFSNWKLPSLFGNGGASINVAGTNQTTTPATPATNNNQTTQQTQQTPNTQQAPTTPATTKADGFAFNKILNNKPIEGEVTKIGNNNSDGYPESFVVTDTTNKKDTTKPNIYTYKFVGMDNGKPKYEIESIKFFCEPKDLSKIAISLNSYRIESDAVKQGKPGAAGKIEGQIRMSTESDKPAMSNHSLTGQGTEHFYPPKKA